MENYQALEALVSATNKKIGYIPSTPSEFNQLSLMINQETERTLSLSSIKRIWGYVPYDGFPSVTTLNTLAFFNGYRDWNTFLISLSTEEIEDSGFMLDSIVNTESLKPGDRLLIKWGVGKSCEIECLGQMNFQVVSSHNIKLAVGDHLKLHTVCVGHPLYASDIQHGDLHLPAYIGAKKGGIKSINFLPTPSRK